LGENYSILIMGDINVDGDGGGVDGDGSGGISPSQQSAGTETSVPQNWSSMAAALRNFSWMDVVYLGFSPWKEYIGRRAMLEGGPGAHTTWW
jgi:hypothetical protein